MLPNIKNLFRKQKSLRAFSAIEQLIIVSVIILITLLVYTQIEQRGSAAARDARRVSELNSLRAVLQMYYMDHSEYPISTEFEDWCSIEQEDRYADDFCINLIEALRPYISETVGDPLYPKIDEENEKIYSYQYMSTSSGEGYKIHSDLETRDPYEVASWVGKRIVYGSPGEKEKPEFPPFVKTMGGLEFDRANSVQQTLDEGYIIAGWTSSFGADGNDFFVVKLKSDGSCCDGVNSWARRIGGVNDDRANSVLETSDGDYIIVGDTKSFGVDFNDFFVVKLNSYGDLIWAKTIEGAAGYWDNAFSVLETSNGDYVIGGYTDHPDPGIHADILVVKLDSNGNFIWAKTIGGDESDNVNSLQETPDGGYIIGGRTASFGPNHESFLVKLDSNGNFVWAKTIGVPSIDNGAASVQQTPDGGYIIAGWADFANFDIFIVKLDFRSDLEWAKRIGDHADWYDDALSLQQTPGGDYIIAGWTQSFNTHDSDSFLVKLDSNGNLVWTKRIGGGVSDIANSLQQTSDGGYIMAGWTNSFGEDYEFLLVKFDSEGNTCGLMQPAPFDVSPLTPRIVSRLLIPQSPDVSPQSPDVTIEPILNPSIEIICP